MVLMVSFEEIVPKKPNSPVKLTPEQFGTITTFVNQALTTFPDHCLLSHTGFTSSIDYNVLPLSWIVSVLPYVRVSNIYNPFITSDGIYIAFNPMSDYMDAFQNILITTLDTLKEFYKKGVVTGANNIADLWSLKQLSHDEIIKEAFYPDWIDNRFAFNPVDFLLSRITGDTSIRIKISKNLVYRHALANVLIGIDYHFETDSIVFTANNLFECQRIASLIDSVSTNVQGYIVTFSMAAPFWAKIYETAISILYNVKISDPSMILYSTDNISHPYTFSILFSLAINPLLESKNITDVFNTLVYSYSLSLPPRTSLASFIENLYTVQNKEYVKEPNQESVKEEEEPIQQQIEEQLQEPGRERVKQEKEEEERRIMMHQ